MPRRPPVRLLGRTALLTFAFAVLMPLFPAASPRGAAASGEWFPCRGHACSCNSPDHCWTVCACYTHDQKLALARAHGLDRRARALVAAFATAGPADGCCSAPADSERGCADDAPAPPAPSLVPFSCQGLAAWLLIAPPPCLDRAGDLPARAAVTTPYCRREPTARPLSRARDVPTPPPRTFPAS